MSRIPIISIFIATLFLSFSALAEQYGGIGIMYGEDGRGGFYVQDVYANSPAEQAGVQVYDKIISIEGVSTYGMTSNGVSARIRGVIGTKVTVVFENLRHEQRALTMVRALIDHPMPTEEMPSEVLASLN